MVGRYILDRKGPVWLSIIEHFQCQNSIILYSIYTKVENSVILKTTNWLLLEFVMEQKMQKIILFVQTKIFWNVVTTLLWQKDQNIMQQHIHKQQMKLSYYLEDLGK